MNTPRIFALKCPKKLTQTTVFFPCIMDFLKHFSIKFGVSIIHGIKHFLRFLLPIKGAYYTWGRIINGKIRYTSWPFLHFTGNSVVSHGEKQKENSFHRIFSFVINDQMSKIKCYLSKIEKRTTNSIPRSTRKLGWLFIDNSKAQN